MLTIFKSGGPVMYPLLACSLLVLTVVIDRFFFWLRLGWHRNQQLVDEILELCRVGDWETVRTRTAGSRDYLIQILIVGILHREFSMSKAMESAAADEIKRMRRYMGVLDTMITVAPLLGIFGTVTGIITSFEALGAAGIEQPQVVTAGIAQALITTAAGLGIAIFSIFPYNYYTAKVEKAALAIEKYATSLEIVYEKLIAGRRQRTRSGAMKLNLQHNRKVRIEMIPLIDIVFLLLVFFIYAMLSMAVHRGLPVSLPRSSAVQIDTRAVLTVTVTQTGSVYVDKEPVQLEALTRVLAEKAQATQEPGVLLFADRDLAYQDLFSVLDRIRSAGLERISLQAEIDPDH